MGLVLDLTLDLAWLISGTILHFDLDLGVSSFELVPFGEGTPTGAPLRHVDEPPRLKAPAISVTQATSHARRVRAGRACRLPLASVGKMSSLVAEFRSAFSGTGGVSEGLNSGSEKPLSAVPLLQTPQH